MSVVFLILKIVGIILLVLLGLIVLLLLLVLFVPFRYRLKGTVHENLNGRFVFHWLFHLIRLQCDVVDLKPKITLRILGIPKRFPTEGELEAKKSKKKKREKKKPERKQTEKTMQAEKEPTASLDSEEDPADKRTEDAADTAQAKGSEQKERSNGRRIKEKIFRILHKIKSIPNMIVEKIRDIKGFLLNIKSIIRDEANKNALLFLLQEARIILRHISPRKIKLSLTLCAGDPALTGQILGICSTFPFFYRYDCVIRPDFETEAFYIDGSFDIRGYIRGLHLLVLGIRLLRNKDIKKVMKNYRK